MIFVDTGAWFASIVPSDSDHQNSIVWLTNNTQSLVTTDYVIDETLTLLRARGESKRAIILGEAFFSGKLATIYYLTEEDVRLTWQIFRDYSDKKWSFTDCSSKVIMEKLGIIQAFSFDYHFRQFGIFQVVP
ncbi:MAG: PIN domain-containing protein [Woronichinia naegeliana WA131]|jgi:predicted nucleic acid-binding protein|uniref:PIN domain-containing protein n=1 Tax=Woronichinia naegeliana WA131 TaxID=2824559 RepID=A0A977L1U9_9CYAN|nr:MAG: PIN domain-containing protein [Woronichinia naegeliana WA131]